jgi:hypothetical protein
MLALAAGCELPALCVKMALAVAPGRHLASRLTTRLHDGAAKIGGSTPHHDLDASGGTALPEKLGGQLRGLLAWEPPCRFCRKFRFWGKIRKSGIRNSMTYRLPNSRKSKFATEPGRQHIAIIVSHGDDLLALLMFIARIPEAIVPFLATVLVPSPCSTRKSSVFASER